ncbi:MAG: exopolysaccharide biosynthesis polyprenyl glycosylphosphotransferase [Rhodospirillales bacterium]|nr:exopolysaccharide biosynthesis polyprenyl glycosylphosphotransferase [Rhodospirillales bacterium]
MTTKTPQQAKNRPSGKKFTHRIPSHLGLILFLMDALALLTALITSLVIFDLLASAFYRKGLFTDFSWHDNLLFHYALFFVLILANFANRGHYTARLPWWQQVKSILKTVAFVAVLHGFTYFSLVLNIPANPLFGSWALAALFLLIFRRVGIYFVSHSPDWTLPVVLFGDRHMIMDSIYAFYADGHTGYQVKTVLLRDKNMSPVCLDFVPKDHPPIKLIDGSKNYNTYLKNNRNYFYIIGLDGFRGTYRDQLIKLLEQSEIEYAIVPPTKRLHLHGMNPHYFFGNDFMMLYRKEAIKAPMSRLVKRLFDIFISGLCLIVLGLITLAVIIGKKLEGADTPIFYGGARVGMKGNEFKCWKFNTMHRNADQLLKELIEKDPDIRKEWFEFKKLKNDPRVDSRISKILRKTSLDELPQLWNVFVGDMSLVGPRPILPDQRRDYGDFLPYYESVRPGITGLWQVSGRNETTFDQRVYWDGWYIKNWSLWNDIVILFKTVGVLLTGHGAY